MLALLRTVFGGRVAQRITEFVKIDAAKHIVDGFGTHFGDELLWVGILQLVVPLGKTGKYLLQILLFQEQFVLHHTITVFLTG